jgi:hypothetical protein
VYIIAVRVVMVRMVGIIVCGTVIVGIAAGGAVGVIDIAVMSCQTLLEVSSHTSV